MTPRRRSRLRISVLLLALVILPAFTAAGLSPIPGAFDQTPPFGVHGTLMLKLINGWRSLAIDTGIVVRVNEGVLEIEPVHGSPQPTFNGFASARTFDFSGTEWHIRADLSHLHLQNGIEAKFRVTRDHAGNYLSAEPSEAGYLHFMHRAKGVLRQDSIPYDPLAHSWFRIRHVMTDDTIRWDTSPDGRAWTERWRDVRRFDLRSVFAEVYAGSSRAIADPGFVRFSDFGGGPSSAQPN